MNRTLWSFIVFLTQTSSYGQSGEKIYFDSYWDTCHVDKHEFYRIEYEENDEVIVKDYYKNGVLQMEGRRSGKHKEAHWEGHKKRYYENGVLKEEIMYFNNQRTGNYSLYNTDGQIIKKQYFSKGIQNGYDSAFHDNGQIKYVFNFSDNLHHLEQFYFFEDTPLVSIKKRYEKGIFKNSVCYDKEGQERLPCGDSKRTKAKLKDDIEMNEFISENIRFSKKIMKNKEGGYVLVQFIITKEGELKGLKVVKSSNNIFNEEVLRVIRLTEGKWIPAYENGEPIDSYQSIPVRFQL